MDIKRLLTKSMRIVFNPPSITESKISGRSKICSGTQVNYSSFGKYSYCGHNCFFLKSNIDSYVSIADNCRIGGGTHPISRVSTSPVFHQGRNIINKNFQLFNTPETDITSINSDVWIGANVIVISGITIGVGAIIGAGSVVTHDVPPYEIWAGNPARKIRERFDKETREFLLSTRWWTWDDQKISYYSKFFDDPENFRKEYMKGNH